MCAVNQFVTTAGMKMLLKLLADNWVTAVFKRQSLVSMIPISTRAGMRPSGVKKSKLW